MAMALLAAAPLALSLAAGAQTLSRDLGFRLPEAFGTPPEFAAPEADTLDAPVYDPWLGRDKAYHVGVSFGLALGAHVALTEGANMEPELSMPLAGGFAFGIGLAKEMLDARRAHQPYFSWRDLAADAAGVLLALGVASL